MIIMAVGTLAFIVGSRLFPDVATKAGEVNAKDPPASPAGATPESR